MRACPSSRYGFVRTGTKNLVGGWAGRSGGPLSLDWAKISGPAPRRAGYWVVTATLVAPRGTPPPSVNLPNTRLFFASSGMVLPVLAKMAKVGV